jgi:hypothetical protein
MDFIDTEGNSTYIYNNDISGCNSTCGGSYIKNNFGNVYIYNNTLHDGYVFFYLTNASNVYLYNNTAYNINTTWAQAVLKSYNINFTNNLIYNYDVGISISSGSYNILIDDNKIFNSTKNNDNYFVGILILSSNNVTISNNNISNYGSNAVLSSNSTNIYILNNFVNEMPFDMKLSNLVYDWEESPSSYRIAERQKYWTGTGDATESYSDNITKIYNYRNINVTIINNTFGSNVKVMLITQGTDNLVQDLTGYWYRNLGLLTYLENNTELYVSNSYDSIGATGHSPSTINYSSIMVKGYHCTYIGGYCTGERLYWTLSKTQITIKNIDTNLSHQGNPYNTSFYSMLINYPFNDIKNTSTNSILSSNVNNYSITLTPNQQIEVGDFPIQSIDIVPKYTNGILDVTPLTLTINASSNKNWSSVGIALVDTTDNTGVIYANITQNNVSNMQSTFDLTQDHYYTYYGYIDNLGDSFLYTSNYTFRYSGEGCSSSEETWFLSVMKVFYVLIVLLFLIGGIYLFKNDVIGTEGMIFFVVGTVILIVFMPVIFNLINNSLC